MGEMSKLELGVFLPIGNNGFLMSKTAPQYAPSFEMNKQIAVLAESFGFDFVFSMSKWRGFGGETGFWDTTLESLALMTGLAAVTSRIGIIATIQPLLFPPAVAAKMIATIDDVSKGRFGINIVTGSFLDEYEQMGALPDDYNVKRYKYAEEWLHVVKRLWTEEFGDLRRRVVPSEGLPLRPASGAEAVPQHHLRRHVRRRIPVHRERGQLQLPQRHHRRPYERAEPADESDRCGIWPGDQDRDDAVADRRRDAGGS